MRKASVRDLHINTSELVRDAEGGETIVIERRGEPVAELRPLTARPAQSRKDIENMWRTVEALWEGKPMLPDSTPLIEEDRNR